MKPHHEYKADILLWDWLNSEAIMLQHASWIWEFDENDQTVIWF